jgi:hypothetical protein
VQLTDYTPILLSEALSNLYTTPERVRVGSHFEYFCEYLGERGLGAKQIVIESDYISRDFLHDHAAYYVLCFENYPKSCKRVHFFDREFDLETLSQMILSDGDGVREFWTHYLGFIVVKPIPVTVIGTTVLKTYPPLRKNGKRHFWGVRDYEIHLYGKKVTIKSLAFQEQDSVLAACATTAIWIMLNKAATHFHTVLKSPSQITKDAAQISNDGSRLFPNKGLDILQICQAIDNSGLVCEVKQPDAVEYDANGEPISEFVSCDYLKRLLNAYAPIGIPVILVIRVPNEQAHGLHAITVSGYMSEPMIDRQASIGETLWMSSEMQRIYAHDDQWGPFSKILLEGEGDLITPWTTADPSNRPTKVRNVIVPLYPKIRISYEDIEEIVIGLDAIFKEFFGNALAKKLIWDIKIDYSEKFKDQLKSSSLPSGAKLQLLLQSLPKYVWVVTCHVGEVRCLDIALDATDVRHGNIWKSVICYLESPMQALIREFLMINKAFFKEQMGEGWELHLKALIAGFAGEDDSSF